MEEVNARATNNKVLFRFGILEPKSYDLVDVVVRPVQFLDHFTAMYNLLT